MQLSRCVSERCEVCVVRRVWLGLGSSLLSDEGWVSFFDRSGYICVCVCVCVCVSVCVSE